MRFLIISLFFLAISCGETVQKETTRTLENKTEIAAKMAEKAVSRYENAMLDKLGMDTTQAIPTGLQVGDIASDFRSIDQNGDLIHLAEQLSKGLVVVVFYRGQWCGICNKYLAQFADSLAMVKDKGASIIVIAPEVEANVQKTLEKTKLDVPAIADKGHKIMDSYKVTFKVNEAYQKRILDYTGESLVAMNGDSDAFLPVPATYVIGQDGKIKAALFDPKYSKRMSVKDILAVL
ncbi:MAG: peroxiredoxin [Paraglaciecola sp.]|jgi:peroxiredoxin